VGTVGTVGTRIESKSIFMLIHYLTFPTLVCCFASSDRYWKEMQDLIVKTDQIPLNPLSV